MNSRLLASLFTLAVGLTSVGRAANWAPESMEGLRAIVVVSDGTGLFADWGGYRLDVGPKKIEIGPLTPNIVKQSGTYTYAKLGEIAAKVIYTDEETGAVSEQTLEFESPTSATLKITSTYGTQRGTLIFEGVASANRFVNLSTRGFVGTGDNVMIAGFVIEGASPKRIIVRAVGPTLQTYGVTNALTDPSILLYRQVNGQQELVEQSDDWSAETMGKAFAAAGAAALPDGSKDAGMIVTLEPGLYTAIVRGKGDTSGVALLEIFELF